MVKVDPIVKMFRRSCTDCGARKLRWISPQEAEESVPGFVVPEWSGPASVVWVCARCGCWGAFGGVESGGF